MLYKLHTTYWRMKNISCFTRSLFIATTAYGCVSLRAGFLLSRKKGNVKEREREREIATRRENKPRGWLRGWKSKARRDGLARANHLVCIHLQGILFPAISPRAFFSSYLVTGASAWFILTEGENEGVCERERERSHSGRRRIPPFHNDVLQERLIFITPVAPLSAGRNPTRCTAHLQSRLFTTKRKKIASFRRNFYEENNM